MIPLEDIRQVSLEKAKSMLISVISYFIQSVFKGKMDNIAISIDIVYFCHSASEGNRLQ